jgi:hypothetical protein
MNFCFEYNIVWYRRKANGEKHNLEQNLTFMYAYFFHNFWNRNAARMKVYV